MTNVIYMPRTITWGSIVKRQWNFLPNACHFSSMRCSNKLLHTTHTDRQTDTDTQTQTHTQTHTDTHTHTHKERHWHTGFKKWSDSSFQNSEQKLTLRFLKKHSLKKVLHYLHFPPSLVPSAYTYACSAIRFSTTGNSSSHDAQRPDPGICVHVCRQSNAQIRLSENWKFSRTLIAWADKPSYLIYDGT